MVSLSNHESDSGRQPSARGLARHGPPTNLPKTPDRADAARCNPPIEERLMRLPTSIACTGLIALALLTGPGVALALARADEPYAVAVTNYEKIPAGATYVTDLNENTELTSNAEGLLKQALGKRGLDYDANGTIGFALGTARTVGSRTPDAVFDSSNTILHLNFNSGDVKGAPRLEHSYRIALSVYDRASGRVLSRGVVTDDRPDADPFGVTGPMIEKLLDGMEF